MEEDLLNIKKLYQAKVSDSEPGVKVAQHAAQDNLKGLQRSLFGSIATFLITAAAIIYIDRVNSAQLETSVIGFWILLFCAVYYAGSRIFLVIKLRQINPGQPVLAAIKKLNTYKKLNVYMLTYGEFFYVLLLSVGVYFYILPIADFMTAGEIENYKVYLILVWSGYILWILFNTIYLKRRKLRSESRILTNHIHYLQSL